MSLHKYPKIKYPKETDVEWEERDDVTVLEKLDGANGRFTITDDGEVLFGSRNVEFSDASGEPLPVTEVNDQFKHAVEYLNKIVDPETFHELADERSITLFGEALHKHRIDYDAWEGNHPEVDTDIPNFVLFEVHVSNEGFLDWSSVKKWARELGLTVPKVVSRNKSVSLEDIRIPSSLYRTYHPDADSEFDRRGSAEGVVLRTTDGDRSKIVSSSFKEKNISSTDTEDGGTDYHEFVQTYITRGRVLKKATELQYKDKYADHLEMKMMDDLHEIVYTDALEEAEDYTEEEMSEETLSLLHEQASDKTATLLQNELQR
jgi:hypothetical protein